MLGHRVELKRKVFAHDRRDARKDALSREESRFDAICVDVALRRKVVKVLS